MLLLDAADVRRALPMREAIEGMKQAFAALSDARTLVPHRAHLPLARNGGVSLVMSAYVDDPDPAAQSLTVKVVSLFDGNRQRGLARIQATVLALDPQTGCLDALLEGATLTAIRTAAASGAATDLLARPDSHTLALFGAGVQAREHVEAMCAIRPIRQVRIYSRSPERIAALIADLAQRPGIHAELIPVASPGEALAGADIVCATTTSRVPIFADADVRPGTHVNAVGSYTPAVREIPPETVVRARVVVDSREAAWLEAGDLIQPLEAGLIDRSHIHAELGELVLGSKPGRAHEHEITFFKSVGIAVQDAVAARIALQNARQLGVGRRIG